MAGVWVPTGEDTERVWSWNPAASWEGFTVRRGTSSTTRRGASSVASLANFCVDSVFRVVSLEEEVEGRLLVPPRLGGWITLGLPRLVLPLLCPRRLVGVKLCLLPGLKVVASGSVVVGEGVVVVVVVVECETGRRVARCGVALAFDGSVRGLRE